MENKEVGDFIKSPTKKKLEVIDSSKFFPLYAPGVDNWKSKLRGYNSKKKPVDFTASDYFLIVDGLKKYTREIFLSAVENEK